MADLPDFDRDGGLVFAGTRYEMRPSFMRKGELDATEITYYGMTMRDYFAALALTGMRALSDEPDIIANVARACYLIADAMLAERVK